MTTFLFENPIFLEHHTPEGHPERSDRIRAINLALEHERFSPLVREKAPQANEDFVLLAHPESHLRAVMSAMRRRISARSRPIPMQAPPPFKPH
jgi:acetoin utilization deacetylase AcuC-like enzyme